MKTKNEDKTWEVFQNLTIFFRVHLLLTDYLSSQRYYLTGITSLLDILTKMQNEWSSQTAHTGRKLALASQLISPCIKSAHMSATLHMHSRITHTRRSICELLLQ